MNTEFCKYVVDAFVSLVKDAPTLVWGVMAFMVIMGFLYVLILMLKK